MMKKTALSFMLLVALMALSLPASAKKVYLNGIDLSGYLLTNVVLKCVTVRFDAKGNIYIEAPDYKIMPKGKPKQVTQDDPNAKQVYFTTFPRGNVPFDIELWINGKLVRRVYTTEGQVVEEITKHLRKGKNDIMIVFLRRKARATGSITVMVAKGYESKGTVILRKSLVRVSKNGKDAKGSYTLKYTIVY